MPYNDIDPRGQQRSEKPDAGGAVLRSMPMLGTVKNNVDPTRQGRIEVYLADMSGNDPNDSSCWVTVNFLSPFFGKTTATAPNTGYGEFIRNSSSYGEWHSPPDIGSTVLCVFVNGDPNFGYYIGCVTDPNTLYMVPAVGGADNVTLNEGEADSYGGATRLPVTNFNTNNEKLVKEPGYFNNSKPVHSYQAAILNQQGLIRDPIRGVIGSTSQRESPSRVGWGVSTPGRPIYEGGFTDENILDAAGESGQQSNLQIIARRGGHTFVMDDGDLKGFDQLVRLKTSLGHQILLSDSGQTIFIIHSNGQSWIELGKEGTIDMYATNSVNIRTQGDLNLHADNNININAKKDLNLSAENIGIQSEKDFTHRVGNNYSFYANTQYTVKVNGPMSMYSSGEASYASGSTTFINGPSRVNLNTGSASLTPNEVKPLKIVAHPESIFDKTKGWLASPGTLTSIVSRAPTHQPFTMANKGVDVKVDNNASSVLPNAPPTQVQETNENANTTTSANDVPPTTPPVAATVPPSTAVSSAIDKSTTSALVSQSAVIAATGAASSAVAQGAAIVQTAQGAVASIGKLAQSPTQLQDAGFIKPGAAALINNAISAGSSLESAIPANLFTGKAGVNNLTDFTKNISTQVSAQVTNFQQAQRQLTESGLISGTESPTQIAGVVMSTALTGLSNTANLIQNAGSGPTGAVSGLITGLNGAASGAVSGAVSGVTGAISGALGGASAVNSLMGSAKNLVAGGNIAGNLANNLKGSISGISGSFNESLKNIGSSVTGATEAAKGAAASAFAAISNSLPKLKAGEPQNIRKIAEEAAKKLEEGATAASPQVKNALTGAAGTTLSGVTDLAKTAATAVGSATNALGSVTSLIPGGVGSATNLINQATSLTSGVAGIAGTVSAATKSLEGATSGLGNIPGGEKAVAALVDNATNLTKQIPGVSQVTDLVKQKTLPNLSTITNSLPNLSGTNLLNQAKDLAGSLTGKLNDLASGKNTLSNLISAGLPASAASQLNSAISAISSAGQIEIKMPVVATNTTDRTQVDTQLGSVLGSSKIPKPSFNINSFNLADYDKEQAKIEARIKRTKEISAEIEKQKALVLKIRDDYQKAIDTYPPGDPKIVEQRELYYSEKAKWQKLINSLVDA